MDGGQGGHSPMSLMRRFPYIIYFRRVNPERIRITVVKHQRRHPDYGRERK